MRMNEYKRGRTKMNEERLLKGSTVRIGIRVMQRS